MSPTGPGATLPDVTTIVREHAAADSRTGTHRRRARATVPSARPGRPADAGPVWAPDEHRLERHRSELRAHCRRMLGSTFEADDAVQETLVRGWRGLDGFEGRATMRSWLYQIATNVCVDMLRKRKELVVDMTSAEATGGIPGTFPSGSLDPHAAGHDGPGTGDPADMTVSRESVHQALATLQLLPPRQRAVLILGDVLRWRAEEIARLLGCTVASVNSARQRARARLAAAGPGASGPSDAVQRQQLDRIVDAFHRLDVDALVALVRLYHLRGEG